MDFSSEQKSKTIHSQRMHTREVGSDRGIPDQAPIHYFVLLCSTAVRLLHAFFLPGTGNVEKNTCNALLACDMVRQRVR